MSDTKKLTPASLAALLCARICHDLVSPVSALGAAIEVLDDEDSADMRDDALDLIRTSSRAAAAKLQFLRLAFGAGGSAPGIIGTATLKTLIEGVYGEAKADLVWKVAPDGLDKPSARLCVRGLKPDLKKLSPLPWPAKHPSRGGTGVRYSHFTPA